ncbi:hypothetical protein IWX78_001493 [Mycetocola sp. CAN_C7]|uniref:DUF2812 domain-containing protein n=1 Tax=Mycetocola sp. CAN_C7 TaxID=2787724 RepID=UPI0018CB60AD
MRIFKMFVDFDKEEAWLNEMAGRGQLVTRAGLLYTFAPIPPGSAVIRVDHQPSMKAEDFDDYRSLFADAGWQHLAGTRGGGEQYFASFSGEPNVDIFSENGSKAQRYRRAIATTSALLLPLFTITVALWSVWREGIGNLLSPRDWYLTPGLWQREGWEFARAFAFETPFVALRVGGPAFLIASCLVMLALIAYQSVLYRRAVARANG